MGWLLLSPSSYAQQDQAIVNQAIQMAQQLRDNYGIIKSTYLTTMAWQLSQSFASDQQLKQQWQQALNSEQEEISQFLHTNTHALMAQVLIQYSNGMTLNRWRMVDLKTDPIFPTQTNKTSAVAFNTWVNLAYFWHLILTKQSPENQFSWLKLPTNIPAMDRPSPQVNKDDELMALFKAIDTDKSLAFSLNNLDYQIPIHDELSVALIRQKYHHYNQRLLAFAYDWIEIYQLIELSPRLYTVNEQEAFKNLLNQAQSFWQSQQIEIDALDSRIYQLTNSIFDQIPDKFKNPDHINVIINRQILSLLFGLDDPEDYLTLQLRADLQENLEVCLNLSADNSPKPQLPIAMNQFNSCYDDFFNWAQNSAKAPALAGNLIKIDNSASLARALELPSFQIINNLAAKAATDANCQNQLEDKANVFEWLLAAESLAWFHDRWPGLMASKNTDTRIDQLITQGLTIHQFPECLNSKSTLNAQFAKVSNKWEKLKQAIRNQVADYSQSQLSTNSDIDFFASIDQQTEYIPPDMQVTACDVTSSCGAFVILKPSVTLLDLFPNHLKLAQQFGLGQMSLCYDEVVWNNRTTVPTHLDNNKITNYEGNLSLQLVGKFDQQTVFKKPLLSQDRHIYLFGENNQETLDLACPLPVIGKQINTSLDRGTFGLLPNRLTFLTAQKIDINAVIKVNWPQWQVSSNDVEGLKLSSYDEMTNIKALVNDTFLDHVNNLQQQIYRKLITSNPSRMNDSALSKAVFEFLTERRLLTKMVTGLYPDLYLDNNEVRAALNGTKKLVDESFFRSAFQNQLNILEMMNQGDQIFNEQKTIWPFIQSTGSNKLVTSTIKQLKQIKSFASTQ